MTSYAKTTTRSASHASLATTSSSNTTSSSSSSTTRRHSTEDDYYTRLQTALLTLQTTASSTSKPPTYEMAVSDLDFLPILTKPPVQPRSDEGRETLPQYSCSIKQHAVFLRKMELEDAIHKAQDRKWKKVWVELQGTVLRVCETKSAGMFSSSKSEPILSPDQPAWIRRGEEIKRYSLQHAEVGIAADYTKRQYVMRIRAETEQFLLSCLEIETLLSWIESITAAIDLAPPLEDRTIPIDQSIPRSLRRRQNSSSRNSAGDNDNNGDGQTQTETEISTQQNNLQATTTATTRTRTTSASCPHRTTPSPQPRTNTTPKTTTTTKTTSTTEEGKWKPPKTWSTASDKLYAKRCLSILLSASPRKTNLVFVNGRDWFVDWNTGELVDCYPPGYSES